jgi:two-component system, OmpR family, sensor histidine kinase KdpD
MISAETQTHAADALFAAVKENPGGGGRLHVFLGMCGGVGKTYRMLEAALQYQTKGVRVLVGRVESHGSPDIEDLLARLPSLFPRRDDEAGGGFSLDHALHLAPAMLVVDAMAAVNETGSRHARRYQDILELLDGGIDVLTTLNVQEIESQSNVLPRVPGLPTVETVPDSVLDRAHEVNLVDVSVEALLERLEEGRINLGEKKEWEIANFFTLSNLTALREMTLRFAASRVDRDLEEICKVRRVGNPLRNRPPLLVGIGPGRESEKVIQWAHRAAAQLDGPWVAVWVDGVQALMKEEKEALGAPPRGGGGVCFWIQHSR